MSTAALFDYRLATGLICFDDNLRYWVKPRSTTWFSEFLMDSYDDERWIEQFRMDKPSVAEICHKLRATIEKNDTNYRLAIPVEIRVFCCLYKLAHAVNMLSYSELFAIGHSTVGLVIREVVSAINIVYSDIIRWPRGPEMREVMTDFKAWCGMPSVHGAIDCTHISIAKPASFPEDYYYFKTGGYSVVCQAVVDCKKLFTSLFIGLPGSVNDSRVLRRSGLWQHVHQRRLMHIENGCQDAIPPYLLGDKGYPLTSWLLTPFKEEGEPRSVAEELYNKRHRQGRSVVENAFGLMKMNWREMLGKTALHVEIVPDVLYACCILHNLTIRKGGMEVEEMMRRLAQEARTEVELRRCGRWTLTEEDAIAYSNSLERGDASRE
jgi:hypothetical protein